MRRPQGFARVDSMVEPLLNAGLSYEVSIGTLVNETGVVDASAARNIFRIVSVTATAPITASGAPISIEVSCVVTAP